MRYYIILLLGVLFSSDYPSTESNQVLFNSSRNGNSDIFLMNDDGTNQRAIVNSSANEWGAVFMDKNNISFLRQVNDSVKRFSFNLKTKKETEIGHPGTCYLDDKNAIFSKDGHFTFSCNLWLFVKEKNQEKYRALGLVNKNTPKYLSWSFDGKSILYTDDLSGSNDIYSVNIETRHIDKLTNDDFNNERGDLSPDGKHLVYSSNRHNKKDQDLFILNLETNEVENISNSEGYDLIGRWSLDGKHIFYGSNKDGNWEIYRYTLADKSTKRLTSDAGFDGDPRVR